MPVKVRPTSAIPSSPVSLASPKATPSRTTLREDGDTAFWIVVFVVCNATLCSGVAWLVNFCCSYDNVLSFKSALDLFHMFLATLAQVVRAQSIATNPEQAPLLWFCFAKLVKRTLLQQLATAALVAFVVYFINLLPSVVRPLKLELYLNCVCSHLFVCYADLTVRRIIRQEILVRRASVNPPNGAVQHVREGKSSPSATIDQQQQQKPRRRPRSYWRAYWRHFFLIFPMMMFVLIAGLYVHTTRNVKISRTRQTELVLFTCGSTLLKMFMQKLAKRAAIKKKINNARTMCIIVGVPTVLIDTQIRLVVQRIQTTQGTISGTILMAVIEIVLRGSKLGLAKFEIYHHEKANLRLSSVAPVSPMPSGDDVAATAEAARWKRNVWKLYMAETYANMAAEYIAIGCSSSIMFFYRTYPKYQLGIMEETPSVLNQFEMVTLHIVIEVLVDLLTCTLEIRHGMDFRELRKHGAFVLAFFTLLVVINIQISSDVCVNA